MLQNWQFPEDAAGPSEAHSLYEAALKLQVYAEIARDSREAMFSKTRVELRAAAKDLGLRVTGSIADLKDRIVEDRLKSANIGAQEQVCIYFFQINPNLLEDVDARRPTIALPI